MKFETLLEKIRNPLRKKELIGQPTNKQREKELVDDWKDYILGGDTLDKDDLNIREKYLQLKRYFPQRAESWLNQEAHDWYTSNFLRDKVGKLEKILDHQGVQVFLDPTVTVDFSPTGKNYESLVRSVAVMLDYIRELLPNRKPRIVIVGNDKHKAVSRLSNPALAMAVYSDRIIYIKQEYIQPSVFIHEYAHYVADLIPKQTYPVLKKAYEDMLDSYWKRAKVKREELKLQASDPKEREVAKRWRQKIATKLGYPDEYGLTNPSEFFAVLIENWKSMPSNAVTYRFKNSVKQILQRL